MPAQNRTVLKSYFQRGLRPTQSNYADLIDSFALVSAATPAGGSNGQIQYNNGGFLAGLTVSGDATLATSGVLTIANNAVTTSKILDASVTTQKLANSLTLVTPNIGVATATSVQFGLGTPLNSYEEGTWTPSFTFTSGSITTSTASGFYTKIGRLVHCSFRIVVNTISSPSGAVLLNGLPFLIGGGAGRDSNGSLRLVGMASTFTGVPILFGRVGTTTASLEEFASGTVTDPGNKFAASAVITGTLTYQN